MSSQDLQYTLWVSVCVCFCEAVQAPEAYLSIKTPYFSLPWLSFFQLLDLQVLPTFNQRKFP